MTLVSRRLSPLAILVLLATLLLAGRADAVVGSNCQALRVPVSVTGVPGATIYGELCRPPFAARGVQLLVHGATYDHNYWDWPDNRSTYSYVQKANAAGYATFNVDRLGTGQSTHPASTLVNLDTDSEALHGVIEGLRKGTIGGRPYQRVIWVGHSLGTIVGWAVAARYAGDVDAFVLTGMTHVAEPTWLEEATGTSYPAALDPKFANSGLDSGYLTTRPGTRGSSFYYQPGADPSVIARDEALKEVVTATELEGAFPLYNGPPSETALSRAIQVPTLIVVGQHDGLACPPSAGCTAAALRAREAPYYSPQARPQVLVVPYTGHDLQLHRTAPLTSILILGWLAGTR
jgi:pimeloyl-ACP methyl ester carboxylesterase